MLDRNRPYGTITGSQDGSVYEQDGKVFDAEGKEIPHAGVAAASKQASQATLSLKK